MNQRWLIINADDFGDRESVNRAVMELFSQGRVTSCSLLAVGATAAEAAALAARQRLSVGVHWTLHSDWPQQPWRGAAPRERSASLWAQDGLRADAGALRKAARSADVTNELTAQARFLLDRGCAIDHADSHGGTLYGANGRLFFLNAFRLCRRLGLPFRFPLRGDFLRRQFGEGYNPALGAAHRAIAAMGRLHGVALPDDMLTNPFPAERCGGYEGLRDYYLRGLRALKPGVTELFLHPALEDPQALAWSAQWHKRLWEMRFLQSGEFARALEQEGFLLTSWRDAPLRGRRGP